SVLLGNGDGSFQSAANFPTGKDPFSVAVADLNGDGKQDLAIANSVSNSVSVLLGNGNGSFQDAANFPTGTPPRSVAAAHLNGRGKPALAVANNISASVSVLLGQANAATHLQLSAPASTTAGTPVALTVRALDAGGKADVRYGGTVQVSSSDG